jgi:hypothetical protein
LGGGGGENERRELRECIGTKGRWEQEGAGSLVGEFLTAGLLLSAGLGLLSGLVMLSLGA